MKQNTKYALKKFGKAVAAGSVIGITGFLFGVPAVATYSIMGVVQTCIYNKKNKNKYNTSSNQSVSNNPSTGLESKLY